MIVTNTDKEMSRFTSPSIAYDAPTPVYTAEADADVVILWIETNGRARNWGEMRMDRTMFAELAEFIEQVNNALEAVSETPVE